MHDLAEEKDDEKILRSVGLGWLIEAKRRAGKAFLLYCASGRGIEGQCTGKDGTLPFSNFVAMV